MTMSLWFYIKEVQEVDVFDRNITHNLGLMATKAGIYKELWRAEEVAKTAGELIPALEDGLLRLKALPEHFKKYNAENGWGMYEHFVPFVEEVLAACREHPEGKARSSV